MKKDPVVYSTELGRMCPECEKAIAQCCCNALAKQKIFGDGVVRIRKEKKGRGGKTVIVVSGLPLPHAELSTLLSDLKRRCGTGGTIKDGCIEIQGEHTDLLRSELIKRGYKPKG